MNISNKSYLESLLATKKLELKETEIQHRIAIAEINIKKDMLKKDIDSIEDQLSLNIEE